MDFGKETEQYHLLVHWAWVCYLIFLSFSFLFYKRGENTYATGMFFDDLMKLINIKFLLQSKHSDWWFTF